MTSGPGPPVPSGDPSPDADDMIDPKSGERVPTKDMREQFARISAGARRDPRAERAFIDSKIAMIRSHPGLSEEEKAAAITELQQRLKGEPEPPEDAGPGPG